MDKADKILVVGDVGGRFHQLFRRMNVINEKNGPFQMLLCVGEFFSPDDKQNDELIDYKNVCLPTYILGPNSNSVLKCYEEIKDGVICTNLTYLGKRGLFTLSSGLRIAYLSGLEHLQQADLNEACRFNEDDVLAVRSSCLASKTSSTEYRGVDILLTSPWPYISNEQQKLQTSKMLSYLCKEIRPRYHFCGLNGKYYEPAPYRTPADDTTSWPLCTRLLCLAKVGNENKEKYMYAVGLNPVSKATVTELLEKTTNEIISPFIDINYSNYSLTNKQELKPDNGQYFFGKNAQNNNECKRKKNQSTAEQKKPRKFVKIDQEICWFCLSCPNAEKHLVITVWENFYLALAKGPISDYHVLILSITHIQSASELDENGWEELNRLKDALRKCFQNDDLSICFTERNYKSSHLQINVFGVDESNACNIPKAFEDKAKEFQLDFEKMNTLNFTNEVLPKRGPYFVAELPDGDVWLTKQMRGFPLHFARDVFCSKHLLNCKEKVNWRDCNSDKETELALVESFRNKFAKYDIN